MALTRKVRRSGFGLSIQIPSQMCLEHGIREGEHLAWETIGRGILKVRRLQEGARAPAPHRARKGAKR